MMRRLGSSPLLAAWVLSLAGCAVCENCDLHSYSAYGGRWQRIDRNHGRVGSVYDLAGAPVTPHPTRTGETVEPETSVLEGSYPELDELPWQEGTAIEISPPAQVIEAY